MKNVYVITIVATLISCLILNYFEYISGLNFGLKAYIGIGFSIGIIARLIKMYADCLDEEDDDD